MQMDYGGLQESDRLSDNVFYNPIYAISAEFGAALGAKGIAKYAHRQRAQAGVYRDIANKAYSGGATGFGRVGAVHSHMGMQKAAYNKSLSLRGKARANIGHARTLRTAGRFFGMAGFAMLAFEGFSALGKAGDAFATSRSEVESSRYQRMYDQESFYDTRAAFTQRQRALQVIHNSRLSLKPALGNESMYLHY